MNDYKALLPVVDQKNLLMDLAKEILKEHSKTQCRKIVAYIGKNPSRFKKLVQIYLAGPYH